LRVINKHMIKKCLELFCELAENKEDFTKFYEAFSKNLKLGIHEDAANRSKLAELLRFYSVRSPEQLISFKDYVQKMQSNQKSIYYITGERKAAVLNSPFLETLKKREFDVLLMTDPIDEYAVQSQKEYEGKKLLSVTKEGLDIELTEEEKKVKEDLNKSFGGLCQKMKELLGDKVEKVVISDLMTDSPCVLVTAQFGWSANMERIMKAQALRDTSLTSFMVGRKIMELNPHHPIIVDMCNKFDKDSNDKTLRDSVLLLFETSILASGFSLEDPQAFANRIHKLIKLGLDVGETSLPSPSPSPSPSPAPAPASGSVTKDVELPPLEDENTSMEQVE